MRLIGLCLALAVACGCSTPSLNPAYTEDTIVYDEAYVGTWLDQDRTGRYEVRRHPDTGYDVLYTRLDVDEPFKPVELQVVVFEVGQTRFFDVMAGQSEIEAVGERLGTLMLPVHNFGRLSFEGETLFVDLLDMEWLNTQRATLQTAHSTVEDVVVLTAPPEDLQKLLERADTAPNAFSDEALILEPVVEGGGG